MTLVIRLIHDVDAVDVGKLIEPPVMRIVAGANGIDIVVFVESKILQDIPDRLSLPEIRLRLVSVHPFDLHGHTIQIKHAVPDFHISETDQLRDRLDNPPPLFQGHHQGIEIRTFGRPRLYSGKFHAPLRFAVNRLTCARCDALAFCIEQFEINDGSVVGAECSDIKLPVLVVVLERGIRFEIANLRRFIARPEPDRTEDSRQSPEVLIFQPRAVAPAIDLDREFVFALFQVGRDIELHGSPAAFAVADLLAVHPNGTGRIYPFKVENRRAVFPSSRDGECTLITADRIIFRRRIRGFRLERVFRIRIDRHAMPVLAPVRRYRNGFPVRRAVIGLPKIHRTAGRIFRPVELPIAVERPMPRRGCVIGCPHVLQRLFLTRIGHHRGVRLFHILLEDLHVLPLR